MKSSERLLFIEPTQPASRDPVIDRVTRRMCAAYRRAKLPNYGYGGIHECFCGALSSACDYRLPGGELTNSLCVHYLAFHRAEVPREQLAQVESFHHGEAEPSEQDLQSPEWLLARIRANLERRLGPERLRTWIAWGLDIAALAEGLRGGCLPESEPERFTPVRRDAHDLRDVLYCVPTEGLPCVRETALRSYGSLEAWSADALGVPGWRRDAWLAPLRAMLSLPESTLPDRRPVRMALRQIEESLGPVG